MALLLGTSKSMARAPGERVAVVRLAGHPEWSRVEHRIVAELRAAGFEAVLVEADAETELSGISEANATVAALRIVPGHRVTVQVMDRATGKSSQRELDARGSRDAVRVALQAVELLYASLLELETAASPPPGAVRSGVAERVARRRLQAPRSSRTASFRASALALSAPGGLGTLAGLDFGAAFYPLSSLGLGASLAATAPTGVREGDASAWFSAGLARLVLSFEPWPLARFSPSVEARLGAACGIADGESDAGAPTQLDLAATWHGGLALALATAIRRDLRLRGSFEVARNLEPLQVRFGGTRVAELGPHWFGVGLGLEWLN